MSADIVLTEDTLRYIALFEQITKANAIDCMDTEDKLVFVVEKGQGNVAVGKKGEHVIKLKDKTGKNIQVVEYSDDPEQFVKNVFSPFRHILEYIAVISQSAFNFVCTIADSFKCFF